MPAREIAIVTALIVALPSLARAGEPPWDGAITPAMAALAEQDALIVGSFKGRAQAEAKLRQREKSCAKSEDLCVVPQLVPSDAFGGLRAGYWVLLVPLRDDGTVSRDELLGRTQADFPGSYVKNLGKAAGGQGQAAAAARVAGSIRAVNFQDFTYPADCQGDKGVRTRKGAFHQGGDDPTDFKVAGVQYGDLTGDGQEEALVVTTCDTGGVRGDYTQGFVFGLQNGAAVLIADVKDGDRALDGIAGIAIESNLLVVERYAPETPGAGACCPEWIVTTVFKWDGRKFIPIKISKRKA